MKKQLTVLGRVHKQAVTGGMCCAPLALNHATRAAVVLDVLETETKRTIAATCRARQLFRFADLTLYETGWLKSQTED